MSYWKNWPRHLIAPLSGDGFSNTLARDFCRQRGDLWEPATQVSWRWLKLMWVYSASAITQLTFPMIIVCAVISIFDPMMSLRWWLIVVGGITLVGIAIASLITTWTYIWISQKRSSGR
jgi:hypothetical protein